MRFSFVSSKQTMYKSVGSSWGSFWSTVSFLVFILSITLANCEHVKKSHCFQSFSQPKADNSDSDATVRLTIGRILSVFHLIPVRFSNHLVSDTPSCNIQFNNNSNTDSNNNYNMPTILYTVRRMYRISRRRPRLSEGYWIRKVVGGMWTRSRCHHTQTLRSDHEHHQSLLSIFVWFRYRLSHKFVTVN